MPLGLVFVFRAKNLLRGPKDVITNSVSSEGRGGSVNPALVVNQNSRNVSVQSWGQSGEPLIGIARMTSDWSLHTGLGKASACGYEVWWPQSRGGGVSYSILM